MFTFRVNAVYLNKFKTKRIRYLGVIFVLIYLYMLFLCSPEAISRWAIVLCSITAGN